MNHTRRFMIAEVVGLFLAIAIATVSACGGTASLPAMPQLTVPASTRIEAPKLAPLPAAPTETDYQKRIDELTNHLATARGQVRSDEDELRATKAERDEAASRARLAVLARVVIAIGAIGLLLGAAGVALFIISLVSGLPFARNGALALGIAGSGLGLYALAAHEAIVHIKAIAIVLGSLMVVGVAYGLWCWRRHGKATTELARTGAELGVALKSASAGEFARIAASAQTRQVANKVWQPIDRLLERGKAVVRRDAAKRIVRAQG
jgi:hypothetical protein